MLKDVYRSYLVYFWFNKNGGSFNVRTSSKTKENRQGSSALVKKKIKRCDICRSELSSMTEKRIHFKEIQSKIKYVAKLKNPA